MKTWSLGKTVLDFAGTNKWYHNFASKFLYKVNSKAGQLKLILYCHVRQLQYSRFSAPIPDFCLNLEVNAKSIQIVKDGADLANDSLAGDCFSGKCKDETHHGSASI